MKYQVERTASQLTDDELLAKYEAAVGSERDALRAEVRSRMGRVQYQYAAMGQFGQAVYK